MRTTVIYFQESFPLFSFLCKDIYTLPRKVTINAKSLSFLCKIIYNVIYLNKNLRTFVLSNT